MPFYDQQSKNLEERGTAPLTEGSRMVPSQRHIARMPWFGRLRRSTHVAVFEQFEHWLLCNVQYAQNLTADISLVAYISGCVAPTCKTK